MSRTRLTLILLGILLFGVLTFGIGLVVGLTLDRPAAPPAAVPVPPKPPLPGADPAAATPAVPEPGPAKQEMEPAKPAGDPPKGAAADAPSKAVAANPPSKPAAAEGAPKPAIADDPPSIIPTGPPPPVVTQVSSVIDPTIPTPSPLLGPLAAQAATPALPPIPPEQAPPTAAGPPPNRVISVQLGRFTRLDSATVFSRVLAEKGIRAQIVMADYPGMPPWYLVTLGPQPDEPTARRQAVEMSRLLEIEVIVISWAKPA